MHFYFPWDFNYSESFLDHFENYCITSCCRRVAILHFKIYIVTTLGSVILKQCVVFDRMLNYVATGSPVNGTLTFRESYKALPP